MFARSAAVMSGSTVPETSTKRTHPCSTNVDAKKDNANNCTCGMDNKVITSILLMHCGRSDFMFFRDTGNMFRLDFGGIKLFFAP